MRIDDLTKSSDESSHGDGTTSNFAPHCDLYTLIVVNIYTFHFSIISAGKQYTFCMSFGSRNTICTLTSFWKLDCSTFTKPNFSAEIIPRCKKNNIIFIFPKTLKLALLLRDFLIQAWWPSCHGSHDWVT